MLTVQALQDLGADTKDGLARCLNNEAFYLRLVTKGIMDDSFEKLKEATEAGDLNAAFEQAHKLKGVTGNLSLTQLYNPISEMTELLRKQAQTDYTPYLTAIMEGRQAILSLL